MANDNRRCPECAKQGHDSKGDHLFLMEDGNRWCCNRVDYHENGENYYEDEEEIDISAIQALLEDEQWEEPVVSRDEPEVKTTSLPDEEDLKREYRGIQPASFDKYNVSAHYNDGDTLVATTHYLYSEGKQLVRKVRKLPKDFYCEGKTKGHTIELFGQQIFRRAKRLLITEGEYDAMSAYQMLKKYNVAVVSLPLGANIKSLMDNVEYLKGFKEVTICMDQDAAGKENAKKVAALLPTAKFMLGMSEKDANDMLIEGKEQEFISCFFDADIWQPDTIVRVSDVMVDVMREPEWGVEYPWPTLTQATYGRRAGEGMYVGAGVKIGKSEWINQLIAFDIENSRKIAILKFEEVPAMTVKRVAGKMDGIFYHKPDVSYNRNDLEKRALSMQDYLYMYPAFGPAYWENVKEFIRYAALSGCTTIVIDPITRLTNMLNSSDTETELRKISDEIARMAQDMGFFYIITCHLKAPYTGPPHERGGKVQSNQFRGSRAMMEACYYMLGIQRNKDPDLDDDERNTSTFVLLEDRAFGNTCNFPVFFNKKDQSYMEPLSVF